MSLIVLSFYTFIDMLIEIYMLINHIFSYSMFISVSLKIEVKLNEERHIDVVSFSFKCQQLTTL